MELTITQVDYAPEDLEEHLPVVVEVIRRMPGRDRPDYWLARVRAPLQWAANDVTGSITHVVLATHLQGTRLARGANRLWVGIAYVKDDSLLADRRLDFAKVEVVALGMVADTTPFLLHRVAGKIRRLLSGWRKPPERYDRPFNYTQQPTSRDQSNREDKAPRNAARG